MYELLKTSQTQRHIRPPEYRLCRRQRRRFDDFHYLKSEKSGLK